MCSPALPVWDFENGSDCNSVFTRSEFWV
jgi:hypothetical protein